MKVLAVSEQSWPEGGGGTLATHSILGLLAETQTVETTVVTGTRVPETLNGVKHIYTQMLRTDNKVQLWINLASLARQSWFLKLLNRSDAIYIPRYCYPLIPLAKKSGKRVVVHLHDYQPISYNATIFHSSVGISDGDFTDELFYEIMEHESTARAVEGAVLSPLKIFSKSWVMQSDRVICVSERQAEIIRDRMPGLSSKLEVIYNPPPAIPTVERNLNKPAFLYLGGDSYVKGFDIFLRVSKKVLKRPLYVKFLITRDLRNGSKLLIDRLNHYFKGAYKLLGHVRYEELYRLYSNSMALIFPSIWEEPLPYAVVESMLCGTMPISSRVGGVPEIVEGTYAENMLFKPGDINGLVDALEEVVSMSREQLTDIGASLRENTLNRFDTDHIRKQLLPIFT